MLENKRKVLVLANTLSGVYNVRKELISALQEFGCEVHIGAPQIKRADYFEEHGCYVEHIDYKRKSVNPLEDLLLLWKYYKLMKRIKPDAVLTYAIKPNVYGGVAARWCGVPQLANITGLGVALEKPGKLQRIGIWLYRWGLKKAKVVFFQNEANKDFCLKNKMVRGRNRIIPGSGVSLDFHSLLTFPSEDSIEFVFISRILKEKGIDQYLETAKYIKKKYPNTVFHVIGESEDAYDEILREYNNEGYIVYHGGVPDVRPVMGKCSCLIHPSYYPEGMSNVLQEASAAGRAIITTRRAGCGEICEDGVTGFLVNQQDTKDLINKVERFISLPHEKKKEMGLAGRRKIEKEFDRNIVISAYLDELKNILK